MPNDPLLAFLRKRTPRRFAAVVRAHRDDLLNAAYRILGDRDQAEDIAQEVFLKLLTVKWDPERIRSARGLLTSTAVLTALARARAEGRRTAREARVNPGRGGEPGISQDDILDVRDAVLELPEGLRAAVELRYFGGLSVKETALALGCAFETVKDRLARARELLRERLGPASGAFLLAGLAGGEAQALPAIVASAALRRALRRFARQGPGLAAVAAGAAGGGSSLKPALAAALLALLLIGAWLHHRGWFGGTPAAGRAGAHPSAVAGAAAVEAPASPWRGKDIAPVAIPAALPEPRGWRVVDDAGQPVAGARLVFAKRFHQDDEPVPKELAGGDLHRDEELMEFTLWTESTESDADGGFDFPPFFQQDQPARGLGLFIAKSGFIHAFLRYPGRIPARGSTLELRRAPIAILQVIGEEGAAIERFRLRLDPNPAEVDEVAIAGSPLFTPPLELEVEAPGGIHRFEPTRWNWRDGLTVTAPGYPPHAGKFFSYENLGGSAYDLAMRLQRERLLHGVVLDPQGQPVPGAAVIAGNVKEPVRLDLEESKWACPGRYAQGAGAHRASCGPDGAFAIPALPGETWLVAIAERLTPAWTRVAGEAPNASPIVLTIGQHGGLRAACFDGADQPIAGQSVQVRYYGQEELPGLSDRTGEIKDQSIEFHITASTDADGSARFADLPPGHYYVTEGTHLKFEVRAGEVTELIDRAPLPEPPPASGTARVFGRFTVAGRPLALDTVSLADRDVTTDADGHYVVDGVPAGDHWVFLTAPVVGSMEVAEAGIRLTVPPGKRELEFNWNYPLCRFRGRLTSADEGRPVAGAQVDVHHELNGTISFYERLKVAPDGSFPAAAGFPYSSGRYLLQAMAPGFTMRIEEVEIGQEAPEAIEFDFRLERARNSLTLRVENDAPAAVSLGSLDPDLLSDRLHFSPGEVLAPDGGRVWVWHGLPAGRYIIGVDPWRAPRLGLGFACLPVDIPDAPCALERALRLPPGGALTIEVRNASGRRFAFPYPRLRLTRADGAPARAPTLRKEDPRVHESGFGPGACVHLEAMPIGLYRAVATRPGFAPAAAEVEVRQGERAELVLTLSR